VRQTTRTALHIPSESPSDNPMIACFCENLRRMVAVDGLVVSTAFWEDEFDELEILH
jgi:hypothetical protein